MAKTITIIHSKTDPDSIHKFRNFGEELWREYRNEKRYDIDIDEIDHAIDRISITVKSSVIGRAQSTIQKLLKSHFLYADCKVEIS